MLGQCTGMAVELVWQLHGLAAINDPQAQGLESLKIKKPTQDTQVPLL